MEILNALQIDQKIKRLAIEILENNLDAQGIVFAGINNNGLRFAKRLQSEFKKIASVDSELTNLSLSPANPVDNPITIGMESSAIQGKTIIVVDDVANTGRTIFYAMKPLFDELPKKVEVAVLVDRTHKSFPISVKYVGLSLATTLKENIEVKILSKKETAVFLN